jgi:hypothetical protein
MSKVEHRFDDPTDRGRETRLDHNCTCHLDSSFPAGWRELAKPLVLRPPLGATFAASKVIGTNRPLVAASASLAARAAASNRSKKLTNAISALERELGGALFHRKPSIGLTELGRVVRPYRDEIARNADHARDVARTLPPRPDAHRPARQAAESSEHPSS